MSLRVLTDRGRTCLLVNTYGERARFVYREDACGLSMLISEPASFFGEVRFIVSVNRSPSMLALNRLTSITGTNFCLTHLKLQESLAKKLKSSIVSSPGEEGNTNIILVTNVRFLLQSLLSKGELAQLLFSDSNCLREWGKNVLQ